MWQYLATLTAMAVVAPLPRRFGYLVGRVVADITFLIGGRPRDGISTNIRHALGPSPHEGLVNHVSLGVFRNIAKNLYDLIALPRFHSNSVEKRLTIHGWRHLEDALAPGKGVILASIHMGNMDMAIQVLNARSVKLTVLAEPVQPPELYQLNRRLREYHGISILPVSYSGLKEAISRLKGGEVVAIACDRAIQGNGMTVDFLGEKALMPVGGVELALRTGAAILPAFAVRLKGQRYAIFFEPPLFLANDGNKDYNIRQTLTKIVSVIERYIRRFPDQWMVLSPVWDGSAKAEISENGRSKVMEDQLVGTLKPSDTPAKEETAV